MFPQYLASLAQHLLLSKRSIEQMLHVVFRRPLFFLPPIYPHGDRLYLTCDQEVSGFDRRRKAICS
jgi:hypothetical protein